ncbi:MAG: type II toxin-antitoxin system Phd/YefM family antitoxin [Candidatus Omnitrophica bacterium]|nr:type II toxin-antitoxin system Phd/YefM family antitoxin [Candidatus Omnitrophota bacterium]
MRFVSISELKNGASQVVHEAQSGRSVVVVRHGKPCAAVIRLSEQDIDQLLFEESALVRRTLMEALDDKKHHRSVTLKDYLGGKRSS